MAISVGSTGHSFNMKLCPVEPVYLYTRKCQEKDIPQKQK